MSDYWNLSSHTGIEPGGSLGVISPVELVKLPREYFPDRLHALTGNTSQSPTAIASKSTYALSPEEIISNTPTGGGGQFTPEAGIGIKLPTAITNNSKLILIGLGVAFGGYMFLGGRKRVR